MIKAIHLATGIAEGEIKTKWKETGDLGSTAESLVAKKTQATLFQRKLDVEKVFTNIRKVSSLEGAGTVNRKLQLIAELLTSATPKEAKYIARTLLGVLRIGIGEGSLRDAIAWAYLPRVLGVFGVCKSCNAIVPVWEKCLECGSPLESSEKVNQNIKSVVISNTKELETKPLKGIGVIIPEPSEKSREIYNYMIEKLQDAYNLTNDFGVVAAALKRESLAGLNKIGLKLGTPIKVMLALKVDSPKEGLERVGSPCLVDYKYDGFRMQIHGWDGNIVIFTRRLENVTKQFAEVAEVVKRNVKASSFVLDGEAIGYDPKTGKYRPFQEISQRIKRKYNIQELAKKLPVELNVFDIMYYNGETIIKKPYKERRKLIEQIISPVKLKIQPATARIIASEEEAKDFFDEAIATGHEGIMFKNLNAPYKPGARVGYMVKYKPSVDTVDLVIVGAEYGEGKRASWLSSYYLACLHDDQFLVVGKASTGLKEKSEEGLSFGDVTKLLEPLIISSKGRYVEVKPQVVVEVGYQEIQKSPTYSSGYALRFPRVIRLRDDKAVDEIATLDDIKELYAKQTNTTKSD
ncbi:hypothetical protein DRJ48_01510 [Candidatus Woesearchaeota archaeon]|nr:MAG: hypothetical protein DRJ48_01510 [Candidatus Woesearchaeota archaeon]